MYRFSLWCYWALTSIFLGREAARTWRQAAARSLAVGDWNGEETYEFWLSIGQAWLLLTTLAAMAGGVVFEVWRPETAKFDHAMEYLGPVYGFLAGGVCAVLPAIYASWYRRLGPRPLKPAAGASGHWILAVQVATAIVGWLLAR